MPKQKTKKSVKSRVKVTGSGKILRKKIGTSHLQRKKSANAKHREGTQEIEGAKKTKFKDMLNQHAKSVKAE